jgi:hypothetical protein
VEQPDIPRPEYPRPNQRRERWCSLNGSWEFATDPDAVGEREGWYQPGAKVFSERIVVPFPWQSAASGLNLLDYRGVAWYRRSVEVPAEWQGQRIFLQFGAVDYAARVWVNGELTGTHEGGYTPFAFDITALLQPGGNVLTVRVDDPANLEEIPHGKQRNAPPDPWDSCAFTPSSGIWQSVWLEPRPASHLTAVQFTPDVARQRAVARIGFTGTGAAQLTATITPPSGKSWDVILPVVLDSGEAVIELPVPQPQLWDVETPNLYEVELRLQTDDDEDCLASAFGMRTVAVADGQVLLNGRPFYLRSALDQGFWPESLHTPPSDAAIIADIRLAKELGLNGLRKHIKLEDPRFAYWCDRLGMLLWCDAPCPTRFTPLAQQRLAETLEAMIVRDYNHPSIIVWCIYNESWGLEFRLGEDREMQRWVAELYDRVKQLDPTRLVIDNSGWQHVKTDIVDFHAYTDDPATWRAICTTFAERPDEATVLGHRLFADGYRWQGEPLMMSEYGPGWRDDRSWGFRPQTLELRRHSTIVGYTYTELYDIEHEYCGFTAYDRSLKAFGYDIAQINAADVLILDYEGDGRLAPGSELAVPILLSRYDSAEGTQFTLNWQLRRLVPEGDTVQVLAEGSLKVEAAHATVTVLGTIRCSVPAAHGAAQLVANVVDQEGTARATATLDLVLIGPWSEENSSSADVDGPLVLRLAPGAPASLDWEGAQLRDGHGEPSLFWAAGSGLVRYAIAVAPQLLETVSGLRLRFEAGARPANLWQSIYGKGEPSTLRITLNGATVGETVLPGLHVHAGGALSRLFGLGPGEHGEWIELSVPAELVPLIIDHARHSGRFEVAFGVPSDAAHVSGLTLFGRLSGRYGRDPELMVDRDAGDASELREGYER